MKAFKYMSLLGLADLAHCFDAATSYTVTTSGDGYITLMPKVVADHDKTLLYLHGGGSSASSAYSYYLKTQQIADLNTKIIIMQGPIANGGGYLWFDTVAKGSGTTDSLGNDIVAVQTGANSLATITATILALIDTEKAALPSTPSDRRLYSNLSMVGFSQGAATVVATLVAYNKADPLGYMIPFAGWMPTDKANWVSGSVAVQGQIPFLQLVGQDDTSFCPLSYTSFATNLQAQVYTGGLSNNIKFKLVSGVGHEVTASVSTEMMAVSTNTDAITGIASSGNLCSTAAATTKTTDDCDKADYIQDSSGKWVCKNATYLQAVAFASVASVALSLY